MVHGKINGTCLGISYHCVVKLSAPKLLYKFISLMILLLLLTIFRLSDGNGQWDYPSLRCDKCRGFSMDMIPQVYDYFKP
jgi:hypothetical protein